MTATSRPSGSAGPLVVARRWDQLGGRLGAIVNARSIAELFDLEFRFVWPRGLDLALNDPRQVFSKAFLDAFEIQPSELHERSPVPAHELMSLTDSDAGAVLTTPGESVFVDVNENFDVVRRATETITTARERFRRCFSEIDWSDGARRLLASCSTWPEEGAVAAIHVRAGDIVAGAWRHVLVHEKYSPTPYIHQAIERLTEGGSKHVLVLSDNVHYLAWLKARFRTVITTSEIVPDYARLTEVHRALADIFVLSRCEPIVGPPSSAFSRLAANLGPGELVRADRFVPKGQELNVLCSGIAERRSDAATSDFWGGLVARDISWCLDVFSDTLPLGEQTKLARVAVELDPDFSGALTRFARIAALAGNWRSARDAAARALSIAESAERHDDPLMEALATDIAVGSFAACRGRLHAARGGRRDAKAHPAEIRREFDRCLELHPFWLAREEILDTLRYLISTAERLADETRVVRFRAARRLAKARYDDVDMQRLRLGGLDQHRAVGTYDPLTRDLDRMALHLYEAVHGAGIAIDVPRLAR